ncbi:MAG: translocation/assembly module TamB, partial [Acidobacteria bacterium]|nr:translocation/assembly module TamB [Acidobacteriota bacterium]
SPVLRIESGDMRRGPARVRAAGTVDLERRRLNLSGRLTSLPLRDLAAMGGGEISLEGSVDATATASGTFDNPSFEGQVELRGLRYSGVDLGVGNGSVRLADGLLSLDLAVRSELGRLNGRARISTKPGYAGKAEITLSDWNLERTIRDNLPAVFSDLSTALQGRAEIEGNFAEPRSLRAQGELDGARLKMGDYELHNSGKIRFYVSEAKLRLDQTRFEGEGSNIFVTGEIPLEKGASLDLYLKGGLNLRSLPRMAEGLSIGGSTNLEVRIQGPFEAPRMIGKALVNDLRASHESVPFTLASAQGRLVFTRRSVVLEDLRGTLASGTAILNGSVAVADAGVESMNFQMTVRGARIPYPAGFRSTVDGDLNLRGDRSAQVLVGKINVPRADYLSEFDLLGQTSGSLSGSSGPITANPYLAGVSLNVSITSQDGIYIDNQLANARARLDLMVRGTLAYPSVTGRAEALEGTIFFRGNRFDILRATADFSEVKPFVPLLDIRAETDIKRYRLRIDVTGDMSDPRLNLYSEPPLPTVEVVLLLATGISREDAGATSRSREELMQAGAASLLSAGLTQALDERVERLFGLQSFRLDPYWLGSEKDPTARVTISQRLTKDLTVTYSRNLSTNEEQVVLIEYDVTRNLTLVALQDEKGDLGVDLRFRKRLRR